jgi:TetR/AcrR family transcriptional repressor of multidrug resistance operon
MRNRDDLKEATIRTEAIKMIVALGFDGLSMQKLAKASKISPSTIYVYFKSREDLLNQLYHKIQQKFEDDALNAFDPNMGFEDGLWIQWINRYKNIQENPTEFYFFEQFRNSPLVKQTSQGKSVFRETMNNFVQKAVRTKEIIDLPLEIFWAVAYGAFYMLVKFHLDQSTMAGNPFSLSETKMKQTFEVVMKSLRL